MKQENQQLIRGLPRRIALMALDCGLITLCYWLAILLRYDSADSYRQAQIIAAMVPMLPYVLPIYMAVFWFGGLYEIMWKYAGMRDLARLLCLSGLATGLILLFDLIYRSRPISGTVLVIGALLNTAAIAGVRFLWRLLQSTLD
ncbi:MAG: polysaccharide biosynthesis protein, partial [Gemmiger sp.]